MEYAFSNNYFKQIYEGRLTNAYTFLVTFIAVLYALVSGLTPISLLATMQMFNIPITVTAKVVIFLINLFDVLYAKKK